MSEFQNNVMNDLATYEKAELGKGIYSITDLSNILRIKKSVVRYWVKSYLREKLPGITNHRYNLSPEDGIFVNFSSLLELFVFEQLRLKGHSRKKILMCYQAIADKYKIKYPFTKKKIISAGNTILFEHEGKLINADSSLQINISEILSQYLEKIDFDVNGKAIKFYPDGKKSSIILDPAIQFGTPTISGTRINVNTIIESYQAGDSKRIISKIYNITPQQIEDALNYAQAA